MSRPAFASFPWSQAPEPAAGQKQYGRMPWPGGGNRPYIAVRGSAPGPAVLLFAGHRYPAYPALHGLLRLTSMLDPARSRGALLALPDASGADRGWFARELLEPADIVIDLAGAGPSQQTTGYVTRYLSGSAGVDRRTLELATMLGAAYILNRPARATLQHPGSWLAASGGLGLQITPPTGNGDRERAARQIRQGLTYVLRAAGLLEGDPVAGQPVQVVEPAGLVVAPEAGLWRPDLRAGQQLRATDEIGRLLDWYGVEAARLTANRAGIVLWHSLALAVEPGDPLAMLATRRK